MPVLASLFGKRAADSGRLTRGLAVAESGDLNSIDRFTGRYIRLLRVAIDNPVKVILIAAIVLITVYGGYGKFGHGVEFFPEVEPENAALQVRARSDLGVDERDQLLSQVERRILDMQEFSSIYARSGMQFRNEVSEDTIGVIQLEFVEWDQRRPARKIIAEVRQRTADLAGIVLRVRREEAGPPVGKPVQIELSSRYPELLPGAILRVREALEQIGDFVDVTDTRTIPGIEWQIVVGRTEAARYGADITTVGNIIQLVFGERVAGRQLYSLTLLMAPSEEGINTDSCVLSSVS